MIPSLLRRTLAPVLFLASALIVSGDTTTSDPDTAASLVKALDPSVVQVQYTLRYDDGDAPTGRGWEERCPNCGRFHGSSRLEPFVSQNRPLEAFGLLVSENEVVTPHMMIHPRFIETIRVKQGTEVREASVAAYASEQKAIFLELAAALPESVPLTFGDATVSPDLKGLHAVSWQRSQGEWTATVQPFGGSVSYTSSGEGFRSVPANVVVATAAGDVVAVIMDERLPLDDSWTGQPLAWPQLSAAEMEERLAGHKQRVDEGILRASMDFRSPRQTDEERMRSAMGYSRRHNDEDSDTERSAAALLVEPDRVMILADLPMAVTARLERIRVYPVNGEPVTAQFEASLSDYGVLVARLSEPLEKPLRVASDPVDELRGRLLLGADFEVSGGQANVRHEPVRIADLRIQHRGRLFPELSGGSENTYLFDPDGGWVAASVALRDKDPDDRRWRSPDLVLFPAAELATILSDLDGYIDPANTPRSEDDENRLAWIGVELQALDSGLAREHGVSGQTDNGNHGALVTHVFGESPAEEAGIQPGDILLRAYPQDRERPYPVRIEESRHYYDSFPWDQLDEIPEEYYEYLPVPWTSTVNSFNRMITRFGYGTNFDLVTVRDGEQLRKSFEVVLSPPHFDAAPELRDDSIGMRLRELTFETRRFYRRTGDERSGLIISRVDPGTPAAIAGLKPYELITHANGNPVSTVEDMEEALESGDVLRLGTQRMHEGRIAIIRTGGSQ